MSDYSKETKDGKLIVEFPINVWPGWAPIIVANRVWSPTTRASLTRSTGSMSGWTLWMIRSKRATSSPAGKSHVLWGTLDMIALFAPELVKDSRTVPVVCQQIDFSAGGDGVVARGDIRSINDFRMNGGKRKKVVLAQNSPSHYLIMSLLIDAGIDPGDVDFKWAGDAPSAAKIFVQDPSYDAFVGWSPDIYNITDQRQEHAPGRHHRHGQPSDCRCLGGAQRLLPRKSPRLCPGWCRASSMAWTWCAKTPRPPPAPWPRPSKLKEADCMSMVGKDGGITEGDAHLTNYRENTKFFLDPFNPANFEVVWNSASTIYKSLGTISDHRPAEQGQGPHGAGRDVRCLQGRARSFPADLPAQRPGQYERRGRRGTGPDQGGHRRLRAQQVRARPAV